MHETPRPKRSTDRYTLPASVEGLLSAKEVDCLHRYAGCAKSFIVEIGSYKGGSTVALASGSSCPIMAVDLWQEHPSDRYKSAREQFDINTKEFGDRIIPVNMPSLDAAEGFSGVIDLLFIDSNHNYQHVKNDFEAWSVFVSSGGYVLFHDFAPKKKYGQGTVKYLRTVPTGFTFVELCDTIYILKKL